MAKIESPLAEKEPPVTETGTTANGGVKTRLEVEQRAKQGANWFHWIAGLSLVNSILIMTGADIHFPVGLGITQIIDVIALEIGAGAQIVGLMMSLMVAGLFVFFGVMAQKRHTWAFIAGLILYGLDGLLFVLVSDWLSIAFHAWAFFGVLSGLKATNQLAADPIGPVTPTPYTQPVGDRQTHDSLV